MLSLFFALILSAWGTNPAWADEITVYDGTATSDFVPVAGYYADTENQKVEFIIPASQISSINGATISKIQFHLKFSASAAWGATYEVFVKEIVSDHFEVSSSYYSSTATAIGKEGATIVYTDKLDATGTTMDIVFNEDYEYNGGNLLVGIYMTKKGSNYPTASFYGTEVTNGSWCYYSSSSGNKPQNFIPKTTFTYTAATPGPKFAAYDGSSKLTSPYSYDFGLVTAGTSKTFTLKNSGTESLGISVSETGSFNATLSAASIAAGGEATLTVTMPSATGNSAVTITPAAASGIDPFVINVSGTVRDASKVYLDFSDGQIPDGWTSEKIGSYGSAWAASEGYVSQSGSSESYEWAFTSPKLVFTEGEQVLFETQKYSSSTWYNPSIKVEYSTDGSTWTTIGSAFTDDTYTDWTSRNVTIPTADAKYIRFSGWYIKLRNIYGGQLPIEPKMVVTQPASLDYGIITEATAKTFTIANTGLAALEGITVTSSNSSVFAITGVPTSLAAGTSQEVTITMAATTEGALSSDITVSATGMEDVDFTVTGVVMPAGAMTVDFNDNALPSGWSAPSWSFSNGYAATSGYSPIYMTTPKLAFAADGFFAFKVRASDSGSGDYVTVQTSTDAGANWSDFKTFSYNDGDFGSSSSEFKTVVVSGISSSVNMIRFKGYYVHIDDITGLTYAPVLTVTTDDPAETVSSPAAKDFGECAADASVTYNFTNTGAGTINITGVAITGDGAAAYSTNWTESVAAPFALTITRSYDADRTVAQAAVVTVTTSEGDFVINVTGTDKAANAPELAVTLGGEAVATGAAADFGSKLQAAPAAKTYTITNSGTGTLTGTIATSDDSQFTVSKTSFTLGAAESTTFDLALVFNTTYGAKAATITIHPTVGGLEDIVINATASTLDPEAWTEDFAAGTLPMGWEANNWTVGTYTYYENKTTMALAPSTSTVGTIITPCLTAKKDEVLTWDAYFNWYDEAMTVEYSTDKVTWTKIYDTYKAEDDFGSTRYTHKEMSFTAPAAGDYYLRFTSKYSNGIDNFAGFKLNLPDHIMNITASSIPSSSLKEGKSFDATVTVKENRGVAETGVVAKLYMGTTVIGTSASTDFEANESKVITIPCTPTAGADDVEMHIEVEYAGGTLSTETVTRDVAPITYLTLDETSSDAVVAGTYDHVTLKRKLNAGWNTVCLPFDVADVETVFGTDAKAYNFTSYSGGELGFTSVTTLTASYPYIVYVPAAITDDFALTDITIASGDASAWYRYQGGAYFRGTYAPIAAGNWVKNAETDNIYGVTSEGKIAKAGATASIKGFRAYFDLPAGVGAPTAVFEDATTGIKTMVNAGELQLNGEVYNLSGQKVQNAKKGLYIVNGRKVVVK